MTESDNAFDTEARGTAMKRKIAEANSDSIVDAQENHTFGVDHTIGHTHGNFHNYYSFHPPTERTSMFPSGWFREHYDALGRLDQFAILDVGCNEGNLSYAVLEKAKGELPENVHCSVTGIDLDAELINRANHRYANTNMNSEININSSSSSSSTGGVRFEAIDVMAEADRARLQDITSALRHGNGFQLICLFSITMW
jgi:2-polyprenyl-3-methyl-5-hydroxy-6-metoxy-1,4-benzoquinol methylase